MYADVNQQEAIQRPINHNLSVLPVTKIDNIMIGIITFDDAMDVMEEETTESIQKLGNSEPLNQSYFEAFIGSVFQSGFLVCYFSL